MGMVRNYLDLGNALSIWLYKLVMRKSLVDERKTVKLICFLA